MYRNDGAIDDCKEEEKGRSGHEDERRGGGKEEKWEGDGKEHGKMLWYGELRRRSQSEEIMLSQLPRSEASPDHRRNIASDGVWLLPVFRDPLSPCALS